MQVKKIAIVGGGTAGWLAANHLGEKFKNDASISIDLIESPDIPPIGVGEGTVPNIRQTLKRFGIKEVDLLTRCDATFKQSIKFINWQKKQATESVKSYHHLFDHPHKYASLTDYWLNIKNSELSYAECVAPQHYACEANTAPKLADTPEYEGITGYAYHFNAAKFANLLADNAIENFGVRHLKANINNVNLDNDGFIASLMTDQLGQLDYDFYVDCSGFSSLMLGKALQVKFVDKSDTLLVDKAIVAQVPVGPEDDLPPYTLATAHQAGWIWDIGLTNRRGVGFVYSSSHMSDDVAKRKLDKYLNGQLDQVQHRAIPMQVGYREKMWSKNCVALGLAQGFVEPLEATSILLTDFSAGFLAQRFPTERSQFELLEKRFNNTVIHAWNRVIDFIKLHYCISDRDDSPFWTDNKKPETIPASLQDKLSIWQHSPPIAEDFFSKFEVFDLDNYLYVLYGMGFATTPPNLSDNELMQMKKDHKLMTQYGNGLAQKLPPHKQYLDKL